MRENYTADSTPLARTAALKALSLQETDSEAHGYYSWFLPTLGRNDEAEEQARLMTRAFPLSTGANANLGSVLVFTHRWDEAIAQCQAAIDLNPRRVN